MNSDQTAATHFSTPGTMTREPSTREPSAPGPIAQGMRLTTGVAALWLLLAGPAWLLAGTLGLEGLSYAALLGLVPGWIVFLLAWQFHSVDNPTVIVLTGMVLRMLFVFFGIAVIRGVRPAMGLWQFVVWVLIFYLATLAIETVLVVKRPAS